MAILDWLDLFPGGLPGLHDALFYAATALALCAVPGVLGVSVWAVLGWFVGLNLFLLWAPSATHPRVNPIVALALAQGPGILYFLDLLANGRASRSISQVPLRAWLGWSCFRIFGCVYVLALIDGDLPPKFAAETAAGEVITGLGALALWVAYRPYSLWHRGLLLFWNAYGLTSALAMGAKLALANPELPFRRLPIAIHWYFMDLPQAWALFFWMPLSVGIHLSVFFKLYVEWRTASAPEAAPT